VPGASGHGWHFDPLPGQAMLHCTASGRPQSISGLFALLQCSKGCLQSKLFASSTDLGGVSIRSRDAAFGSVRHPPAVPDQATRLNTSFSQ
jgi:hypothetical protein